MLTRLEDFVLVEGPNMVRIHRAIDSKFDYWKVIISKLKNALICCMLYFIALSQCRMCYYNTLLSDFDM